MPSFMQRSYRVGPDGHTAVCDAIADRRDVDALGDALAWRRDTVSRAELQDADSVLALRAVMMLEDMLDATRVYEEHVPLTVNREQAQGLCAAAGEYISERDVEGYQAPEERERIARLRAFAGPLMDCCSELAAAQDELRERALPV
jgi:hypothetical protein